MTPITEKMLRRIMSLERRADYFDTLEERETFAIATLPASAADGCVIYVSDGLKFDETAGNGTGSWAMWRDDTSEWLYFCVGDYVPLFDGITKTVKAAGGDFTTIQAAYDYFADGKLVDGCKISVDAGTYAENLVFADLLATGDSRLVIEGDTRSLAGLSYVNCVDVASYAAWAALTVYSGVDPRAIVYPTGGSETGLVYIATTGGTSGAAEPAWPTAIAGTVVDGTVTWTAIGIPNNRFARTNGGSQNGGAQFLIAAGVLTVLVSGGNPAFDTDSWGVGDKVICWDGAAVSEVTLTGVAANTLTAAAWPAGLTSLGAAITMKPDRIIAPAAGVAVTSNTNGVELSGFHVSAAAASFGIVTSSGSLVASKTSTQGNGAANALNITDNSKYIGQDTTIIAGTSNAIAAAVDSFYQITYATIIKHQCFASLAFAEVRFCVSTGVPAPYASYYAESADMDAIGAYAVDTNVGFYALSGGRLTASIAVCDTAVFGGFVANTGGDVGAFGCTARNCLTGYQAIVHCEIGAGATSANNQNNTTNYNPAVSGTPNATNGIIQWS